jgi:hypothetical protein
MPSVILIGHKDGIRRFVTRTGITSALLPVYYKLKADIRVERQEPLKFTKNA